MPNASPAARARSCCRSTQSSEFATAIRRKLILEVSGDMPPPSVVLAAATGAIDCLKGERDRRLYSDPYFPELDK